MIGVIVSKRQPSFRSRGEQPVRLVHSMTDQIVSQDPDISFIPSQTNGRRPSSASAALIPAINPGRLLFVTGRAVDLTRKIETV
jgi:hypothetical protein